MHITNYLQKLASSCSMGCVDISTLSCAVNPPSCYEKTFRSRCTRSDFLHNLLVFFDLFEKLFITPNVGQLFIHLFSIIVVTP